MNSSDTQRSSIREYAFTTILPIILSIIATGVSVSSFVYTLEIQERQTNANIDKRLLKAWNLLGGDVRAGWILKHQKADSIKLVQAMLEIKKCRIDNPEYASTHRHLGIYYWLTDQDARAEKSFIRAVELDPSNAVARNSLGNILDKKNKTDKAINQYRAAIKLDEYYTNAFINLGVCLRNNRDSLRAAKKYLEHAIKLDYDSPNAHGNLGAILADLYQYDEAIEHLEIAYDMYPHPNTRKVLDSLYKIVNSKTQ